MATDPNGPRRSREPLPLPNAPCAGDDGKREGGGAGREGGAGRCVSRSSPGPAPRLCVPARIPRLAGQRALPAGILGPPRQSSRLAPRPRDPRFPQDGGAGLGVTAGDDKSLSPLRQNLHTPPSSRSRTPPSPACASPLPTRRSRPRAAPPPSAPRGRARSSSQPSREQAGRAAPRCGQAASERRLATRSGFSAAPASPPPALISGEGSAGPA